MISEKTPLPSEKEVVLPNDVDKEIVELCKALNRVPGFETTSSCFGHGKYPLMIWLNCDTITHLNHFMWGMCWRYYNVDCGSSTFRLVIDNGDTNKTSKVLTLRLESDRILKDEDLKYIDNLAKGINDFVDNECTVCLD